MVIAGKLVVQSKSIKQWTIYKRNEARVKQIKRSIARL